MGVSKHVGDFYGENPEDLDKWFEENKDNYEAPEVDWDENTKNDYMKFNGEDLMDKFKFPPVPPKEQVLEDHKRMFESMIRSSGLTREEFIKRIMEE